MDNEVKQRNRRRKRAQRMQAQRENKVKDGDSGEDDSPVRDKPQRPPIRRKKSKEPLVEEDIIDGFAILGFRTYEDLEVSFQVAFFSRHLVICCQCCVHKYKRVHVSVYALHRRWPLGDKGQLVGPVAKRRAGTCHVIRRRWPALRPYFLKCTNKGKHIFNICN